MVVTGRSEVTHSFAVEPVPLGAQQMSGLVENPYPALRQPQLVKHVSDCLRAGTNLRNLGRQDAADRHDVIGQFIVKSRDVDLRLQPDQRAAEDQQDDGQRPGEPEDESEAERHDTCRAKDTLCP